MLQDANAWIHLGREKLRARNYSAALVFFDQALTLDPENADAWKERATALQKLGSIQEILSASNHTIAIALCERGQQLEEEGDYTEAIKKYDQALAVKPEFEQARQSRSKALKNLQSADFSSFVLLRPSSSSTLTNNSHQQSVYAEAEDFSRLGRYQEAIPYLNEAIKQQPDNHLAYDGRGNALRKLGRDEEAILDLNKAITLQPDYHLAYYHRGDIQRKLGRYREALSDFDKAIELQPRYHLAYNGRGNTYRDLGYYREALSDFDKAIELQPNDHLAYNNRGAAKRKLRLYKEAVDDFKQALRLSHNQNWRAWVNLGWTYFQDKKYPEHYRDAWRTWKEALFELKNLKKIHPQNPEYQRGCGELFWCRGKAQYRYELQHLKPNESWDKTDKSYELALKILTFEQFPVRHLEVWQDLIQDSQYLKRLDPDRVKQLLSEATDLLRRLLEETQSESAKISLSRKFASFNQMGVDVLVQKGETEEALKLAEKRKNTCLAWFQDGWSDEPTPSPKFPDIKKLLNLHTAAIYWHISPVAITTFILKQNQPLQVYSVLVTADDATYPTAARQLRDFENWVKDWKWNYQDYRAGKEKGNEEKLSTPEDKKPALKDHPWRKEMMAKLEELKNILNIPGIVPHLSDIPHLILIPHRDLHLLPLHDLFPEDFTITYLPSVQIGLDLQKSRVNPGQRLLNVENPQQDLRYATVESAAISLLYPDSTLPLKGQKATRIEVMTTMQTDEQLDVFHFTGHGEHDINQPLESSLLLTGEDKLTLRDIFQLDFSRYHLICLSACETALTSKQGLIDEFVGLVSGFLAKGAAYVISALWAVDEYSTALLMVRFYQYLQENMTPPSALKAAQKWLRTVTHTQLIQWYQDLAAEFEGKNSTIESYLNRQIKRLQKDSATINPDHPLYVHPYYWAGFTVTGKV
ncbi:MULTISPECIES: CHAT domain-containing protein [unclassified Coleofasciculus]|uniref:CHAT domain-containing protein n=1 Tax=unclassified Coleofasciculus TaxID=2692782 RepID=UPI001882A9A5|nr:MULTISPECIES: CHAT domain-containing protein [unclassified Coleofasciculus]MBE9126848.1 CHAT domain-containing protein [Coleofasciculus sp. LEGE 07081]MBE9148942.1 CHAT domain-containing protein [Coleofasciculus sp. LEGE 07092]